jgi:D-3-phosphoglycerate dehydrogenase
MNAPVVYVPHPVHERGLALLAEHSEVLVGFGRDAVALENVLGSVQGLLVRNGPITAAHIAGAPALRVIARHGIGVDNIAVDSATAHGVIVANTPQANVRSVAEHVFALLLAVTRRLPAADHAVRTGRFADRDELVGGELGGRQLGVIGMGRIGTRVARIAAHGFGMRVVGFDPVLDPDVVRTRGAEPAADLQDLLRESDVVTVHVPLTPVTRGLIGAAELAVMPSHAIVIHTARGGVVDEEALIARLRDGGIAGAGVDVFADEPPDQRCGYLPLPNVVLSPHTAAHTVQAMERMASGAAEAIVAVLQGGVPDAVVNKEVLAAPGPSRGARPAR